MKGESLKKEPKMSLGAKQLIYEVKQHVTSYVVLQKAAG